MGRGEKREKSFVYVGFANVQCSDFLGMRDAGVGRVFEVMMNIYKSI